MYVILLGKEFYNNKEFLWGLVVTGYGEVFGN